MAGTPEAVPFAAQQSQEAGATSEGPASVSASPVEDFRVRCSSKVAVAEVVELCGRLVRELGPALPEEIREFALRDAQWMFESAVQENVSINGRAWQEASDSCLMDSDIKVLEDQFDEIIVDLTTKRKQHPRKILECVIRTLKAQHETLKQYHPVVHPLDLKCYPDPASRVKNLKCQGEAIAKKISDAMKALPALVEQGEGFSQVLKMQPVIHLQRIHQEVFSSCDRKAGAEPRSFGTQVETTPTENPARKSSNLVLRRKRAQDCPQRKHYPVRPKRTGLDT